jgi:hypothetical protein
MRLVTGKQGWSALFSDDELYRFSLDRPVPDPLPGDTPDPHGLRVLVSCGLNPSKADAFKNDNTVRKEIGFARRWGCFRYVKVNAYAWRERFPSHMFQRRREGIDIEGKDAGKGGPACGNNAAIRIALNQVLIFGGIPLAAWGAHVDPARGRYLHDIAKELGTQWMCLGVNKDGSPKHSLYPPYSTPLIPWCPP